MLPLLLAAATGATGATGAGAGAASVPTDVSPATAVDLPASHELRSGVVVGLGLGASVGGASGYPNNATEIGDPAYYSASGWMAGTNETLFVMGAFTDYLSFGFWFGHTLYRNGDWRSNGDAGGLRVEAFPLVSLVPSLSGLGFLGQFGIGSGDLMNKTPGLPMAQGTQSFAAGGVFYEWAFGHVLGGHLAAGPSLEYDAIWSQPFEQHGLVATARMVFYGGP